jgi:excisionase family DNA binding protein
VNNITPTLHNPDDDNKPIPKARPTAVVYDTKDVAVMVKVSERQVRRWADARRIPGMIRIGRVLRFRADDVDAWIARGCRDK